MNRDLAVKLIEMGARGPKSSGELLQKIKNDPRVETAYTEEENGVWVDLKKGFCDWQEDPFYPHHTIHSRIEPERLQGDIDMNLSVRDAYKRLMNDVVPCKCKDCGGNHDKTPDGWKDKTTGEITKP